MKEGNERAILARNLHCKSILNFIGQYFVELGGIDALVFTAGLGENDIDFRLHICRMLESALGIKIDADKNNVRGKETEISTPDSKVRVFVIPTNEELVIARDTQILLKL
jgi:acetate kinase